MRRKFLRLTRIVLLAVAALSLAAGLAGVFSGWKAAFFGVLCGAAWLDWAQDPTGRQTEVGRTGFSSSTPNLLMAVLMTLLFLGFLIDALPMER